MKRLPSLSALRAFECAARLCSFKLASAELGLTTSAISHQIRVLEQELGQALFHRVSGGVELNETGQQYLSFVRSGLDQLEQGTRLVRQKGQHAPLRISLLSSLSTLWLIPWLDNFRRRFPAIDMELIDNAELDDFSDRSIDAAIRYDFTGMRDWPDLIARPLSEEYVFPVCAPEYLLRYPEIGQLKWQHQHTVLINSRHSDEWEHWAQYAGVSDLVTKAGCTMMDTSNMTLMAARSGMGIALGRTPFLDGFLERGELVQIHNAVLRRGVRHYLVYPQRNADLHSLTCFGDWLVEIAQECNNTQINFFTGSPMERAK